MTDDELIDAEVEVTPWPKDPAAEAPLRAELELACVYEVYVGIDHIEEEAYLRRTDTHDELWTRFPGLDREPSLVARCPCAGDAGTAARQLFSGLYHGRGGFAVPTRWESGPLVDEATFRKAVESLSAGWHRNADAARARETPVIRAARSAGLDPRPAGASPTAWWARCPGGGHHLQTSSESDTFGCGYCRRRGGAAELESFAAECGSVGGRKP
jgi:hypothetical protein